MGVLDVPFNKSQFTSASDGQKALKALRLVGAPQMTPAVTTTPTVTLASTGPDAATPTQIRANVNGTLIGLNTAAFAFSGGVYTAGAGLASFENISSRTVPLPQNPNGFGDNIVDFVSDAPALSLWFLRTQLGQARVVVDGVTVLTYCTVLRAGTAQAGAASTITLDASASAVNGFYFGQWVRITSGTGVGQRRQISGYVGSTKVATVSTAWATNPDNTSTFEVTQINADYTTTTNTSSSSNYFKFDWGGERRLRHYRIETSGFEFSGCFVTSSIDTVLAAPTPTGTPTFWVGDSFGAGTGAAAKWLSLARIACDLLGWDCRNVSIGGTGFLNTGTNSLTFRDRLTPPVNSWQVFFGATGGTYTLTQNGVTTGPIAYNASVATMQSALDSAFGAGAFVVAGAGAGSAILIGQGVNATFAGAMTANFGSITGSSYQLFQQYTGDIARQLPTDGAGNVLPFNIVLQGIHNDTTDNSAGFTTSVLQAEITTLVAAIYATFPTARIFIIGGMYLPGNSRPAALSSATAAALTTAGTVLRKINNRTPFISVTDPAGSGYAGSLQGNGPSDVCTHTDGVHPTPAGHLFYGTQIALAIQTLLNA